MKMTQMPPVCAANLVVNSGNTAYRVDVITFAIDSVLPLFTTRFTAGMGATVSLIIEASVFWIDI